MENLAQLRERNGVSLKDIADRTRIPLRHLEELERGDVSNWPPGVYAKSWARDYADEAGLDQDHVAAFVAPVAEVDISTTDISKARTGSERFTGRRAPADGGSRPAARIAMVVVVLVLLALAAVYVWRATGPAAPAEAAAGQPAGTSSVSPGHPPR